MDKFMSSTWFVRIASFAIAALLFVSVNFELKSDKKAIEFSTSPELDTVVMEDVPVEVYYDTENLVVTGIPENVDVTLKGAKSLLTAAKNQHDFKVYVDLSDPDITIGKRTVSFKINDLNDKIVATINPENVNVNIQEKVTEEFSVVPEYKESVIEDGYLAEKATVSPTMVKITGAKETIEQIAYVKAMLNVEGPIKKTVSGTATIRALDQDMNKLDVMIEPASVEVTVNVSIPDKTVKITPVQKGKVKEGLTIKSMSVDPKKVTLYGKKEVLAKIAQFPLDVDVTNVTGDTEVELTLPKLDHVKEMSLQTVKVKIDTEEKDQPKNTDDSNDQTVSVGTEDESANINEEEGTTTKKFTDLSIAIQGAGTDQNVKVDPVTVNITLSGASKDLDQITAKDILLSVDVSQVTEDQQNVPITVSVPPNVKGELSTSEVKVSISPKDAS